MFIVTVPFGGTMFVLCPQPKSATLDMIIAKIMTNFFMVKY